MSTQIEIEALDTTCVRQSNVVDFARYKTPMYIQSIGTYAFGSIRQGGICHQFQILSRSRANCKVDHAFVCPVQRVGNPHFASLPSYIGPDLINFAGHFLEYARGPLDCACNSSYPLYDRGYRNSKYSCDTSHSNSFREKVDDLSAYAVPECKLCISGLLVPPATLAVILLTAVLLKPRLGTKARAVLTFHAPDILAHEGLENPLLFH